MNERGFNVFRTVCDAADTEACVRALESYAWRDLYSWLLQNSTENGIRGQLLGLMLVEGAARYARDQKQESREKNQGGKRK